MSNQTMPRADMILFMGGITALTAVSVDIILPATGLVARSFGVEDKLGALLVGVYFIAYAVGQLFWGLFSDAFGRRRALIISFSGFVIASLACAMAPSFGFLIAARLVQGLMGGAPVIARAMVRDVASGSEAARLMTTLGAILTVAAMFAPVIGSGLLVLFSWRAIFVALTLLALGFMAYTIFALPETGGKLRPERFSFRFLAHASKTLFSNRRFVVPFLSGSFTFGGFASLGALGAIIAESRYGIAPESFGALYSLAALTTTAGTLTAGQLLKHISLRRLGLLAMSMLSLAVVFNIFVGLSDPGLKLFWLSVCAYVLPFGMIFPTAMSSAMEPAGDMPGFAASLMGGGQMLAGATGAWVATSLYTGDHSAINFTMAGFGGLAVLAFSLGRLKQPDS